MISKINRKPNTKHHPLSNPDSLSKHDPLSNHASLYHRDSLVAYRRRRRLMRGQALDILQKSWDPTFLDDKHWIFSENPAKHLACKAKYKGNAKDC